MNLDLACLCVIIHIMHASFLWKQSRHRAPVLSLHIMHICCKDLAWTLQKNIIYNANFVALSEINIFPFNILHKSLHTWICLQSATADIVVTFMSSPLFHLIRHNNFTWKYHHMFFSRSHSISESVSHSLTHSPTHPLSHVASKNHHWWHGANVSDIGTGLGP